MASVEDDVECLYERASFVSQLSVNEWYPGGPAQAPEGNRDGLIC